MGKSGALRDSVGLFILIPTSAYFVRRKSVYLGVEGCPGSSFAQSTRESLSALHTHQLK